MKPSREDLIFAAKAFIEGLKPVFENTNISTADKYIFLGKCLRNLVAMHIITVTEHEERGSDFALALYSAHHNDTLDLILDHFVSASVEA